MSALHHTGVTDSPVDAEEAYRIGFATAVHPSDTLMDEALAMARTIAGMNPGGVRMCLAHLDRTEDMSRDESIRYADLAPKLLGVELTMDGKGDRVLGRRDEG